MPTRIATHKQTGHRYIVASLWFPEGAQPVAFIEAGVATAKRLRSCVKWRHAGIKSVPLHDYEITEERVTWRLVRDLFIEHVARLRAAGAALDRLTIENRHLAVAWQEQS